jgi:hypothetical protein
MITRPQLIAFAERDDEQANLITVGVLANGDIRRGSFAVQTFQPAEALKLAAELFGAAAAAQGTDAVRFDQANSTLSRLFAELLEAPAEGAGS